LVVCPNSLHSEHIFLFLVVVTSSCGFILDFLGLPGFLLILGFLIL